MLEKEYNYYLENKESLLNKHLDMFIVIKDNQVVGEYKTQEEALKESSKKYELGTFLIQKISNNPEDEFLRFFSRVYV